MKDKIIEREQIEKIAPREGLTDDIDPVRIDVHPDIIKEFEYWREYLEDIAGYDITKGRPVITKILANILNELRTKKGRDEKRIVIEIHKVIGLKKVKVIIL